MKTKRVFLAMTFVAAVISFPRIISAAIIHIPADQPTIQAGIDTAVDGDTVLVADGTYTGDGNRDIDFNGKAITVASENRAEKCIINCQADYHENHRGFYIHSAENSYSAIRGLTVENGYAINGGGILLDNASTTISQCIITQNVAESGGGIAAISSTSLIIRCIFYQNGAGKDLDAKGGGIAVMGYSNVNINRCEIYANSSEGTLDACGGGVFCNAKVRIVNSAIYGNWTYSDEDLGGGISCYGNCQIINSVIFRNSSWHAGGVDTGNSKECTIINSIVRSNVSDQFLYPIDSIYYSNIEGNISGVGNIDADPHFKGGNPIDFHLASDSPCIDAGTDEGAPVNDFDGHARPNGGAVDMGIFEFQGRPSVNRSYIYMPAHHFSPGDLASCTVSVWNAGTDELKRYPLFVILSLFDNYYFAPSFEGIDYYINDFHVGLTELTVLPEFSWPSGVGSAEGLVWYAALTNPEMTALASEIGVYDFGWSE
jgi:hypothetical protein